MNKFLIYSLFSSSLVKSGKKKKAQGISNEVLVKLKSSYFDPYDFFRNSISSVSPSVGLKKKKVAGVVYNIPYKLSNKVELSSTLRNLVVFSLSKKSSYNKDSACSNMSLNILSELNDSFHKRGNLFKKQSEIHKSVVSNRPNLKFLK